MYTSNIFSNRKIVSLILLMIVLLCTFLIRFRLLDLPLERDEGEFAYIGQLILQGVAPYSEALTMRLPGTPLVYAANISGFGETPYGIHLGFSIINAMTIILVFLMGRRLFGDWFGLISATVFGFLSLSPTFLGMNAHATHFVIFFALCGFILLFYSIDNKNTALFFASGILFGVSYLMKQHGMVFAIFALIYFVWLKLKTKPIEWRSLITKSIIFVIAVSLPFLIICLWLWRAGTFDTFWFWTFTYAQKYAGGTEDVNTNKILFIAMPILAAVLLAAIAMVIAEIKHRLSERTAFVVGFISVSLIAVLPGFRFFHHYFILILPAGALVVAALISWLDAFFVKRNTPLKFRALPPILICVLLFTFLFTQRDYLVYASPNEASRITYGSNPFPEADEIAKVIIKNSSPNDRIAILGSEPEIFFLSKRRSATKHIHMYEMMRGHEYSEKMQMQAIDDFKKSDPAIVVDVHIQSSWDVKDGAPLIVTKWFDEGKRKKYKEIERITIDPENFVTIYKRHKTKD